MLDLYGSSDMPSEFIALMRALNLCSPSYRQLRNLNDDQWNNLLRFADLAHLTLPLAMRQVEGLPAWVSERLLKNIADNKRRFRRVESTYIEVAEVLKRTNIEHVVLKGFTLAPDYIPYPWLRQQSDIDLYCPAGEISRAQHAIESIGYEADNKTDFSVADHSPTMLRLGDWVWSGNAFDPEMPLSIEFHFCLWNKKVRWISIPEIEEFWQRRQYRTIECMQVPTFSPVDQLGYLALHTVRNILGRDTITHLLYDLANFLENKKNDDKFWNAWTNSHSMFLREKQVIAFELARQWFACSLPSTVEAVLWSLPRSQQIWLRQLGKSPMENMFVENKDVFWLHWSLIGEWPHRLELLRRTFIPSHLPKPDAPSVVLSQRNIPAVKGGRPLRFISFTWQRVLSYSSACIRTLYRGMTWILRLRGNS